MRCPDCNKFVSFDTDTEPEIENEDITSDGSITVAVRIVNNCAECSQELKEARFDLEGDATDAVAAHFKEHPECRDSEPSLSVDASRTDERQTKDRHGRPITRARYQRQFYGVEVACVVKCGHCDDEIESLTLSDSVQASSMEELV